MNIEDIKKLQNVLEEFDPTDFITTFDRTRPYNGQPWTVQGERGITEVKGITFRDLHDCLIRACFSASGLSPSDYPKSIYDLPWGDMDIMAVAQNMACWVEKYMSIFPNVKPMKYEDVMEHCPIVEVDLEVLND